MKKLIFLLLFFGAVCLYWIDATACGDKFLVVGRGIRYERAYAAKYPASVLIYTNDAAVSKDLANFLKKSGHKIQTANDQKALLTNLESTKFDLVLLTLSDIAALEAKVTSTPSKPIVMPVIYNTKDTDLKSAEKENGCVVKYGGKGKNVVVAIDHVMEAKLKGKPYDCRSQI